MKGISPFFVWRLGSLCLLCHLAEDKNYTLERSRARAPKAGPFVWKLCQLPVTSLAFISPPQLSLRQAQQASLAAYLAWALGKGSNSTSMSKPLLLTEDGSEQRWKKILEIPLGQLMQTYSSFRAPHSDVGISLDGSINSYKKRNLCRKL